MPGNRRPEFPNELLMHMRQKFIRSWHHAKTLFHGICGYTQGFGDSCNPFAPLLLEAFALRFFHETLSRPGNSDTSDNRDFSAHFFFGVLTRDPRPPHP